MNATYAVTASAVYNAFLHITDPTIPRNEGCYRPINIIAPPGTIVNCEFPARSVGGNTEVSPRITDIIFGALADALPDRIPASLGGTSCCFLFGGEHPDTGELYSHFHFEGIGWGGRPDQGRQQPDHRDQRQLPQHPGGGVREPVPTAGRVLPAARGLRRPRQEPGWARHRTDPHHADRPDHRQRTLQPDDRRPLRDSRREAWQEQRDLRPSGRETTDWKTFQRGVRDDLAIEILQHSAPPWRPGEDRLPQAAAVGAIRWNERKRRVIADVAEGFVTRKRRAATTASSVTRTDGHWAAPGTPRRQRIGIRMKGEWIEREPMYLSFDVYNVRVLRQEHPSLRVDRGHRR